MGNCVASERRRVKSVILQCQICSNPLTVKTSLSCQHSFHSSCLQAYFKTIIQARQLKISCPSGCGRDVSYDEIKKIVQVKTFSAHEKNLLENYISQTNQYLFCPTAQCLGIYEIASENLQYFECALCKKTYCLLCRRAQHGEEDCYFGEEQLSKAAMAKAGIKACPHCGRMVDKIEGCNAVKCKCGRQFCHDCGGTTCPHGACSKKQKKV